MEKENLVITSSEEADLDSVYRVLDACARKLVSKGQNYWKGAYPMERVAHMLKTHDVRLVYEAGNPIAIATFTLSDRALFGSNRHWDAVDPKRAKYFSALGIIPEKQGQHIGSFLCERIAEIAKEQGHDTLRLNTVPQLRDYYADKGFEEVHHVDRDGKVMFYMMERQLR